MITKTNEPKFPKFMGLLSSRGMDVKMLTEVLNNKGHDYKYATVLRKLNGETSLHYDDIVIFSQVMGVDETIFFNS